MTASELLVDAALAITALELVVLVLWRRRGRRGDGAAALAANVGAGLWLMVALRAALAGASWPWLAACLLAAGAAHAADLALRLRGA